MDQTTDSQDVKIAKKPKKKSKLVGLWVTLGVVFTLVIAPITAFYICFYDGGHSSVTKDDTFDKNTIMLKTGIDSLDNTAETGAIDLRISTDTFNQLILDGLDEIYAKSAQAKEFVTGLSLETTDEEYTFVADLNFKNIFKTRIRIVTKLEDGTVENESAYIFNIVDIKIGRIGGFYSLLKKEAPSLVNDDFIGGLFKNIGLSFVSDVGNNRIYYLKSSIPGDVNKFMANDNPIYNAMMKEFFIDGLFSMSFKKEGLVGSVNLEPLSRNEAYLTKDKENDVDWTLLREKTAKILDHGLIEESEAGLAFAYLVYGYNDASSSMKSKLGSADLNFIDIANPTTYTGIFVAEGEPSVGKIVRPDQSIQEQVQSQITDDNVHIHHMIATVTESQLNQTIGSTNSIGNAYVFEAKENDAYKVNAFIINNFYVNIFKDALRMVVSISVNGYNTYVCINAKYLSYNNYVIKFDAKELYYGEFSCTEDFSTQIYALIESALDSETSFSFDKTTQIFTVDFAAAVAASGQQAHIEAIGTPTFSMTGNSLSDEGTLVMSIE